MEAQAIPVIQAPSTKSVSNEIVLDRDSRTKTTIWTVIFHEYFLHVVSMVMFFALWHWAASAQVLGSKSALATPLQVLEGLKDLATSTLAGQSLFGHIWDSTRRVLIGFAISLLGVPVGLVMALNPYARAIIKPIFDLFKPMPPLAWISVAILWFGVQESPKIFIIVIGSFVPALLNSYNGVMLIEPEYYDVIRVFGGRRWDEIRHVSVPAAIPAISAGLQIAISSAWGCVLAAEMVSSRSGLGFIILQGMKMSDPAMVMGGMIIIALISWLVSQGLEIVDRRLFPWRRDIKGL